jgi:hypothetical protein
MSPFKHKEDQAKYMVKYRRGMRSQGEVKRQLKKAREDNEREFSPRTQGYVDALEWVLKQ